MIAKNRKSRTSFERKISRSTSKLFVALSDLRDSIDYWTLGSCGRSQSVQDGRYRDRASCRVNQSLRTAQRTMLTSSTLEYPPSKTYQRPSYTYLAIVCTLMLSNRFDREGATTDAIQIQQCCSDSSSRYFIPMSSLKVRSI